MKKGLKSALSVLLVLMLMLSVVQISVSAAQTTPMTITASTKTALPGSSVDIEISLKDNPGVASIGLDVAYNKNILTLEKVTYNTEFGGTTQTSPLTDNPARLLWVNPSAEFTSDAVFATLTFKVSENAKDGVKSPITLTYDQNDIYNINENNVVCAVENGAVTITDVIPGDINNDKSVNNKDVTRLMQYLAHWTVEVNALALDTNGDESVNNKDVSRLMQYLAHWDVELHPNASDYPDDPVDYCDHNLVKVEATVPTCKNEGNNAYYKCTLCGKKYSDLLATNELSDEDIAIAKLEHTLVVDPAVPATTSTPGKTEGSHCSVCGEVIVAQGTIPPLSSEEYNISYNIFGNDSYLQSISINNPNPVKYYSEQGIEKFEALSVDGYNFEGWYDAPGSNGVEIKSIPKGEKGNKILYARWTQEVYDVTYKLYQTPLAPISNEKYLHYTTGKGLSDLPNPTINNYIFLGWYTDDGKEVKNIPAGTFGDLTLNAYWTSKRNLTKRVSKLDKPVVLEETDSDVIYFAYEIGTIENVPLTDAFWTIQAVSGLSQQVSQTYTKQITKSQADSISKTISNTTVDSGTWTLSENWNKNTNVNKTWAEQNGMTQEEADTVTKTSSNTYAVTSSNGGSSSNTDNTGTSTLSYDSQNYEHGNGAHFDAKVYGEYHASGGADIEIAKAEAGWKVGGEISGGYKQEQKTNEHSGSDTTTLDTHVNSSTSSWNNSISSQSTKSASESKTVRNALSQIITNTYGYGESYSNGGGNSETQGFSTTDSESVNSSSTLTYATTDITTTTTTYSTDGKSEGCYRLVLAGTIHVFGIVGYDVASQSYFTYTYNVMDDRTYEFLDYAPDLNFNDYENGCIPFEVPYDVFQYVSASTASTEGLVFKTNSVDGTAIVNSYIGTNADVTIPSFISAGGRAYKVTGISPSAFAGKDVKAVVLSRYIDDIPDAAFKNCTKLESIYGYFTTIGAEAFSGCTSLDDFTVSRYVSYVGENAFNNVPNLKVNVFGIEQARQKVMEENPQDENEGNDEYLERINAIAVPMARETAKNIIGAVIASGSNRITLNLDGIADETELNIQVPAISYVEINGNRKVFNNFKLNSEASETVLNEMIIRDSSTPLVINSDKLTLNAVNVTSKNYCLLLKQGGAKVNLKRDNMFISKNGKAVVCKNPTLVSLTESSGNVLTQGILDVDGNIYVCGAVAGVENVTMLSGAIIPISEADFAKYIRGFFTITFDPTDGDLVNPEEATKEIVIGSEFGELPNATFDYHNFKGWFTEADGGTQITNDTVFEGSADVTLYAHWEDNPTSDWILADEAPDEAKIIAEKWTYDETVYTSSSSSTMTGWEKYNETWKWSDWGAWSGWSTNPISGSDTVYVETRWVPHYKTQYNYSKWAQNSNGYGKNGPWEGTWGGVYCGYYFERGWSDDPLRWDNNSQGFDMWGTPGVDVWYNQWTRQVENGGHTEYRYRTRTKIYTYYFKKTESKESNTEVQPYQNTDIMVDNVQKWVKYISKSGGTWSE